MRARHAAERIDGHRQRQPVRQRDAHQPRPAADGGVVPRMAAIPAKHRKNVPMNSATSALVFLMALLPLGIERTGKMIRYALPYEAA